MGVVFHVFGPVTVVRHDVTYLLRCHVDRHRAGVFRELVSSAHGDVRTLQPNVRKLLQKTKGSFSLIECHNFYFLSILTLTFFDFLLVCLQHARQLLTGIEEVLHNNRTLRNLQIFYHGGISPHAPSLLARILARNATLQTVALNVHLPPGCNEALAGGRLSLVCGCG